MRAPIRWGILGASKFARQFMGPAIHAAEGAELAALATTSPDKAAGFTGFATGLRVHDSYQALLADPDIDAIYVPLPNHLHVDWSLRALDAGKAVLCEKPMTMQADEFDTLIAARDRTGLLAAEAYMIVHHPQWHLARRLIGEGAIGNLAHVEGRFSFDNRTDVDNIRNKAATAAAGCVTSASTCSARRAMRPDRSPKISPRESAGKTASTCLPMYRRDSPVSPIPPMSASACIPIRKCCFMAKPA